MPGNNGWRVYVDDKQRWQRNEVSLYMIRNVPSGTEVVEKWDNGSGYQLMTLAPIDTTQDKVAAPLHLNEDAARALMEALQQHFGAYAGVDYERLRKDYDRLADQLAASREELMKTNQFIQNTMQTIIEGRKKTT